MNSNFTIPYNQVLNVNRHVFEKECIRTSCRFNVDNIEIHQFKVPPLERSFNDEVYYEINAYFLKKQLGNYVVKRHETWWDHFKETYFPVWLLQRFPVKYTEEKLTISMCLPETNIPLISTENKFFVIMKRMV